MSRKGDIKKERKLNWNQEIYKEVPEEELSISQSKLLLGKIKIEDSHMGITMSQHCNYIQSPLLPCFVDTLSFIS